MYLALFCTPYTYVEIYSSWTFCPRSGPSGRSLRPKCACRRTGLSGPTDISRGRPRVGPRATRAPCKPAQRPPRTSWRGRRVPADTCPRRPTARRPCPSARGHRHAAWSRGRHRWRRPRRPRRRSTMRRPPSGWPWLPRFWPGWSWSRGPACVAYVVVGGRGGICCLCGRRATILNAAAAYGGGCAGIIHGYRTYRWTDGRKQLASAGVVRGHVVHECDVFTE